MERKKPNEILIAGKGYTVFCETEGKIPYKSDGKDPLVERLVAKDIADYHASLGHKVYIINNTKPKYSFA